MIREGTEALLYKYTPCFPTKNIKFWLHCAKNGGTMVLLFLKGVLNDEKLS